VFPASGAQTSSRDRLPLDLVCLSVCDVGGSGSHRLEILETDCIGNWPNKKRANIFGLRSLKAIAPNPRRTHGKLGETVGWKKWRAMEHKSGNTPETRKDRG